MTPDQFKQVIAQLGYTQVGIARRLGLTDRTGRRWASGDATIPNSAAMVLTKWAREGLTSELQARIIAGRLAGEFGEKQGTIYVWVKLKENSAGWEVARRHFEKDLYYLTGRQMPVKLSDIHLGPRTYLLPEDHELTDDEIAALGEGGGVTAGRE